MDQNFPELQKKPMQSASVFVKSRPFTKISEGLSSLIAHSPLTTVISVAYEWHHQYV